MRRRVYSFRAPDDLIAEVDEVCGSRNDFILEAIRSALFVRKQVSREKVSVSEDLSDG